MSESTKAQRARCAREARKLASECVEGTAPPLIPHELYAGGFYCVVGLLGHRFAGNILAVFDVCEVGDGDALNALIDANNKATDADRHGAVVFPLLALADEIEAQDRPADLQSGPQENP